MTAVATVVGLLLLITGVDVGIARLRLAFATELTLRLVAFAGVFVLIAYLA